ncbi:MAG: redoxin domain-containing protein [Planctomycetota bacterium]
MRSSIKILLLAFLLPATVFAAPRQLGREPSTELPTGPWSARLLLGSGNMLYFELEIERASDGTHRSFLSNADERIEVPATHWHLTQKDEPMLQLHFPHYDSAIRARMRPDRRTLVGWWTKDQGDGEERRVQFVATAGRSERFPPVLTPGVYANVAGRWRLRFDDADDDAVLLLRQADDADYVEGTLLTTTGDHRWLEGRIDRGQLRLSTFDGAHAFLITGSLQPDGALAGSFRNGSWYATSWTAERDDSATLSDPLAATRWLEDAVLADLEGSGYVEPPLFERDWLGRPAVVTLFGTWCPNCHDEAELLNTLARTYDSQELLVLGLAFELSGDLERSRRQLEHFRARHGTTYPMRVFGRTPKDASARALGTLERLHAYPTTIFVRRDGSVAGVHTGFVGPATGGEHLAERARFEGLVKEILASAPFDAAAARAAFGDVAWRGPAGSLAPPAEADLAPGGVWRDDRWLRIDLANGVAWDPADLDRVYLAPGDVDAARALADLAAPDFARRRAALFRLALARGATPFAEAIALLDDPVPLVQTVAAWVLGHTRTRAAGEELGAWVDDAHAPLAREARRALERL